MWISRVGGIAKVKRGSHELEFASASRVPTARIRSALRHLSLAIGVPQKPVCPSSSGWSSCRQPLPISVCATGTSQRFGERRQLAASRAPTARRRRRRAPAARASASVVDDARGGGRDRAPDCAISAGICWKRVDGRSAEKMSIGTSTSTGPGRPVCGQVERALDDARQIGGAIDAVDALAERPVDLELIRVLVQVHFLVRMPAVVVGRHVAGDHHHRDRVERGVGHAGRGVGQARARGGVSSDARLCRSRARSRRPRARRPARGGVMMKRMRLLPSASSNAMMVWPHRPKITSTPSRSRYSVSRYDAIRVPVARPRLGGLGRCRHQCVLASRFEDLAVVELAEQLRLRTACPRESAGSPRSRSCSA